MKKSVLILTMFALGFHVYSQEFIYSAALKKEQVPPVVLNAVQVDFPNYSVDAFDAVPEGYDLINVEENRNFDSENLNNYQITVSSKDKNIVAYYDEYGNLLRTVEDLKNMNPPMAVSQSMASAYPGWTIRKTRYHMSKSENGKKKEHYNLILTKDGNNKHVHTDVEGHILK